MPSLIIGLLCLAFALLIHEFAHAWMAYQLGDPSAKYEGRLTLNPIVHFEPVGAICLTATYVLSKGTLIMGWAKPVPVNPDNFKSRSVDMALVALAGPFINFLVAIPFSMLYLLGVLSGTPLELFAARMVMANVGFGLFNLIPWPPLDGWKILQAIVPHSLAEQMRSLELKMGIWSLIGLLVVMTLGGQKLLIWANSFVLSFLLGAR